MARETTGPVDVIVTLAVPADRWHNANEHLVDEPAFTKVYRLEFETFRDAMNFVQHPSPYAVHDGLLDRQELTGPAKYQI